MPAPGTAGSLVALLLAPWLFLPLGPWGRCGVLVLVFFLGAWAAGRAETLLGRKDPGEVVVDELLGQWLAYALLPVHTQGSPLDAALILGFVLFRILDIVKPGPIRRCETLLPGGFGVMLDDAAAGAMAACLLALGLALDLI
jgi:phosphatidylglycerophosphatase A